MKKLTLIAAAVLSLTACQNDSLADSSNSFDMKSTSAEYITASALPVTTVNADITSNTTWSGVIELDGNISVRDGATLTIQPGTFIKAKPNAVGEGRGVLIITKSGKINATGTESQPIIFTSYRLLDGNEDTTAEAGDFGGVIILGDAPTNVPTTTVVEGLPQNPQFYFGGTNSAHNGGIMKYVRIEFAGYDFVGANSGNEVNALTLAGVGSGTTLDHIQVSYGQDDSFEFFGGTVNATNLVSFAAEDDNFDFDNGYTGTITCALALADVNSGHTISGGVSDTNGIELDNNAGGTSTALITHPVVNNLTIVGLQTNQLYSSPSPYTGSKYENGIHIRRNGKLTLNDAVITGYPTGIRVEGSGSELSSASTYSSIKVHGFTTAVTGLGTAGIPAANLVVSSTANAFGMSSPFFSLAWNVSPRNCGNFQGTWTKYDFSIVE
ncbi:hypothetical protein MKJ01_02890 [Chryseobacterium sp. SSA4.19]|uniref:hypothetical protein n=1 Tax=Chryseobacterium sp. SSA4.19 TaxID=2919915 RepID=UPI001F4E4462|nr:hypothetical protein [Chryseobacterium sp. SSA4.19]MCJ8152709.1 hypothetical protein [Chryseobacterium sp. SSA4.19]